MVNYLAHPEDPAISVVVHDSVHSGEVYSVDS